jgi:hypothetical protein
MKEISEETRLKMSKARLGKVPWNKGKKTGIVPKTAFKNGHKPWFAGTKGVKKAPKTAFKKGHQAWHKGTKGIKPAPKTAFKKMCEHKFWQGGKSFEKYTVDWTETLKISIRERDKYTCRICGKHQGDKAFIVHHIDYNKKNCNSDNLITLCASCHSKTNTKRIFWIDFFKQLIDVNR